MYYGKKGALEQKPRLAFLYKYHVSWVHHICHKSRWKLTYEAYPKNQSSVFEILHHSSFNMTAWKMYADGPLFINGRPVG